MDTEKSGSIFERVRTGPYIMAGPCSAESEQQVFQTAKALKKRHIQLFRAGIWKPRTSPDSFEGVGLQGLPWLSRVRKELDLPVSTEVAKARHVEHVLDHDIDVVWIGARTTTNPFSVQEIADALKGINIPVIVKNPINPDVKLWIGAIERLLKAGIQEIAVIHRGFYFFNNKKFRNSPVWQIPIELRSAFPDMLMLCDISHICGTRDTLNEVAQKALDLRFNGLMIEVHPEPQRALSDPLQQVTPFQFDALMQQLVIRREVINLDSHHQDILLLRHHIDDLDENIIQLLGKRMEVAEEIGLIKKEHDIPVLQYERWQQILTRAFSQGQKQQLSRTFLEALFNAIHEESISRQIKVMNTALKARAFGESTNTSPNGHSKKE